MSLITTKLRSSRTLAITSAANAVPVPLPGFERPVCPCRLVRIRITNAGANPLAVSPVAGGAAAAVASATAILTANQSAEFDVNAAEYVDGRNPIYLAANGGNTVAGIAAYDLKEV